MTLNPKEFLYELMMAAIDAADPAQCLPAHLPDPPKGRTIVVGAGKAAATMARTVEENWGGDLEGLVVTRYGHKVDCDKIEVIEAAHPIPDAAGEAGARRIMELVSSAGEDDIVLCLISGGASALLALPGGGLTLRDKQSVNRDLLRSGANITEMNCVRKHLSAIKGGRLAAAAAPARILTLAISDVPGDDPAVIGSGPTVADVTTYADARGIFDKYELTPPESVGRCLSTAADETPKPGDPRLRNAECELIATPQMSLDAVSAIAAKHGVTPVVLGDAIEGEAREVAIVMAGIARQMARRGQPAPAPAVLLSGGETTVTVRGAGRGGRNAEFLLALAVALEGEPGVWALAVDTDGIDGTEDNAGAMVTPDTLGEAEISGLEPKSMLANNDGYSFFQALDQLIKTGPTFTNVNDFRAILVLPK
ncbi:MAG: glycerate kinase type-2 family protein [Alphaproteobacteria bacterium]